MPGLDPGIHERVQHEESQKRSLPNVCIDCRVKPGNDVGERSAQRITRFDAQFARRYPLNTAPVRLPTSPTIFAAIASISWSVSVFSRG
jgi:hypothetical protein